MVTEAPAKLTEFRCAFCGGKGKDPFGILSYLSTCCICGGRGTNRIKEPYVRCAFCRSTGVYPHRRLTCTACGGVGVHPAVQSTKPCPKCLGQGVEPASNTGFYCFTCHGAGVVKSDE